MIKEKIKPVIVWFRQDLRLEDHEALNQAAHLDRPIIPLFIQEEFKSLKWKMGSASSWWLHHSLLVLENELEKLDLKLIFRKGPPSEVLSDIIQKTGADTLFYSRRYEPQFILSDAEIKQNFKSLNINVQSFNSALLFEPWEISNKQHKPFQVFTPFWKNCLQFNPKEPLAFDFKKKLKTVEVFSESLESFELLPKIKWDEGLKNHWKPGLQEAKNRLKEFIKNSINEYDQIRDRPDINAVSHLSPYLHFGELSPRMIWQAVKESCDLTNPGVSCFLKQLGWREFAHHLLYHFPKTTNAPLRSDFEYFPWKNELNQLKAWKKGLTGYPLVDAGMRELWKTGWMHNRVRMVVGSFLVKDLLIDWQEGAKWFYDTLVDADLANNTLGWQWVAGCGADAAPYYRIFNPTTQALKFDPDGIYIRRFVPELAKLPNKWIHQPFNAPLDVLRSAGIELGKTYPKPIVDHDKARLAALEVLKKKDD